MSDPVRNISDTALWVAIYRARESARPDAVFHDPYAARLAGARGEEIARSMPFMEKASWSFVARTWLIDSVLTREVAEGADMVVPRRRPRCPSLPDGSAAIAAVDRSRSPRHD
jgi:O-methyltransferase involved in polyketide biosynthesis